MKFPPVPAFTRLSALAFLALCAAPACGQEPFLPLPEAGLELPVVVMEPSGTRFLKPSKSIKPPLPAAAAATALPQVSTPTVARLRRVILLPSGLPQETMRQQMAQGGQSRQPVTATMGVQAPAQVLAKLAELFGAEVNDHTQKKVEEAVRLGLGGAPGAAVARRVQVVGWQPKSGVMAVAVDPGS